MAAASSAACIIGTSDAWSVVDWLTGDSGDEVVGGHGQLGVVALQETLARRHDPRLDVGRIRHHRWQLGGSRAVGRRRCRGFGRLHHPSGPQHPGGGPRSAPADGPSASYPRREGRRTGPAWPDECDLPGQVRLRLRQMVRPHGDPSAHLLTGLRPAPTSQRTLHSGVPDRLPTRQLLPHLLRRRPNPFAPPRTPQPGDAVADRGRAASSSAASTCSASVTIAATCCASQSPPRLASIEAFAAIFVPSIATVPNRASPASGSHQQHLGEQVGEGRARVSPETGDRGVVRRILSAQHPERDVRRAQPLNRPRRPDPPAVGVHQQREQHPWVIPRRARRADAAESTPNRWYPTPPRSRERTTPDGPQAATRACPPATSIG